MSEDMLAYACLGWVCIGWPALWVWVAVNITRYGLGGWVRRSLERAKAGLPPENGGFDVER